MQLFREYSNLLKLLEDLKEGRYLLAKKPINNKIFRLKYYDVIINEIWASYGLVNIESIPDVNEFRYGIPLVCFRLPLRNITKPPIVAI